MKNPHYDKLVKELQELHDRKNADYSVEGNPFSNFEFASQIAAPFEGVHVVFASLIGVKLARMAVLLKGKDPNNESLSDTFGDLANYCLIWASMYEKENETKWQKTTETTSSGPTVGDMEIQEQNYSYAVKLLDLTRYHLDLLLGRSLEQPDVWLETRLRKLASDLTTAIEQMSSSTTHLTQTLNDGKRQDTPSKSVSPSFGPRETQ